MSGFNVDSFADNLDDDYGVFDDVCDSIDFRAVGICTKPPVEDDELEGITLAEPGTLDKKKVETKKKKIVKATATTGKKRGRKPGQKPTCGQCGVTGHIKRTCSFNTKAIRSTLGF